MKIRYITVPIDKRAQVDLDYGRASDAQLIELTLDEDEFMQLYELKIFHNFNDISGSNIDDFEDETISDLDSLKKIITFLNQKIKKENGQLKIKLIKILNLFQEALNRKTAIHFYF